MAYLEDKISKALGGGIREFTPEDIQEIKKLAEMVMVSDTFTNMTADNLPIMQRHEIVIPDGKRKFVLAGVEKNIGKVSVKDKNNKIIG